MLTDDEERALAELTDALAFASEPRTLREIANRLGCSSAHIRQSRRERSRGWRRSSDGAGRGTSGAPTTACGPERFGPRRRDSNR